MTNFEKLKSLSAEKFWEKIKELTDSPFKEYTDYPAWLNSDSENPNDFLRILGECLVRPSEQELILCSSPDNETERDMYILTHSKKMKVLEHFSEYKPYAVVTDLKSVMKVHKSMIKMI